MFGDKCTFIADNTEPNLSVTKAFTELEILIAEL